MTRHRWLVCALAHLLTWGGAGELARAAGPAPDPHGPTGLSGPTKGHPKDPGGQAATTGASADATEEAEPVPPTPLEAEDKRALKKLGRALPTHGLLPLSAPNLEAADAEWLRYARKLVAVFAPDSMKSAARKALLDVRPLAPTIEQLVPRHRRYRALQSLLVLYAERMGATPTPLPETPYKLRVGVTAPEIGLLRDRLRIEGYGDEGVTGKLRDYFDDRLKRALQAWQKDRKLPMTTVIDPLTRRRLNEPIAQPVAELALALARFRALDLREDAGRQIIVHVNAFGLVVEQDGRPELAMPVVVGKNTDRDQTPMLSAPLESIIVNPSWAVPQRIVDERLRVEAKDIPELLIDKGYSVNVDDSGRWRVRMGPGPDNPLGKLKFMLADTNGIYLHDTNARSVFARDARTLSAGCVRLHDPTALARWLLPGRELELNEAMAYPTMPSSFEIEDVVVHLVYQTVLAEDGRLIAFPDIYQRDPAALAELDSRALALALRELAPKR